MALSELAVITVASITLKQTGAAMSYFQTSEQCHKWWRPLLAHFTLLDWEAATINHLAALGAAGWCCGNMSLGAWSWVVLGPMGASCSCAMSGVTFVRMELKCSCCYYLNCCRSALCVCEGAVQLMGFSSFKNPIPRNMISSGAILLQQLLELDIQTVYFEVRRQKNQSRSFLCLCWKQEEETEVELFVRVQIG